MRVPAATTAGAWGLAGVLAALVAAVAFVDVRIGPWFDELFTLFVTRPGVPLSSLTRDLWLSDNHPPLFYLLAWASNHLGASIAAKRSLQLIFLALAIFAVLWLARRAPGARRTFMLFGLGLAAVAPAVSAATELRSYFLTLVASAVAVAALAVFASDWLPVRRDRGASVMLAGALVVALNVHFVTSLLVGAIAATFLARLCLARDWPGVRVLLAAIAVAAAPLLISLALQARQLEMNTRHFWIHGDLADAAEEVLRLVAHALLANPVLSLVGLWGLGLLAIEGWRARRIPPSLDLALVILVGCLAGMAALSVVHIWRPVIVQKYLCALFPAIVLILALGADRAFEQLRGTWASIVVLAITACSLAAILLHLEQTLKRGSWSDSAAAVHRIVANCPGTLVHADASWNVDIALPRAAERRGVVLWAYRTVGEDQGFAVAAAGSREMAQDCPTVFWTDWPVDRPPTLASSTARLRAQGFQLGRTELRHAGTGWLLISRPALLLAGAQPRS